MRLGLHNPCPAGGSDAQALASAESSFEAGGSTDRGTHEVGRVEGALSPSVKNSVEGEGSGSFADGGGAEPIGQKLC